MKKENALSNWGNVFQIATGIITIAPLVPISIKSIRTWMTGIIREHAEVVSVIVMLWLCVTIWMISRFIKNKKRVVVECKPHEDLGITQSSPYILVVDDDQNVLDAFRDKFEGLYANNALLTSLPSSLLANGFDIIISDIVCAGFNRGTADDKLREMKIRYPYKFICAMSSNKSYKDRTLGLDRFFHKDDDGNYLDEVLDAINEYRTKMCKVEERWNEVEMKMRMQKRTEAEISEAKANYYRSLETLHLWK